MTYRGRVKNGVIVLDPPATLPEGAEVEVRAPHEEAGPTWAEVFRDVIGKAEGLPADSSLVHGSVAAIQGALPPEDFSDWEK
jgi:hypothetical protein